MKELNDYKQEIFRRSAEKKRQIKKRRRIALTVGVPLCLCCVIAVTMLPGLSRFDVNLAPSKEAVFDCEASEENWSQNMPMEFFHITDPMHVTRVLAILEKQSQEDTLHKDQLDRGNFTADQVQPAEYRLTLQCSDGSTLCYQIRGQEAYCETTAETVYLTAVQASILHTVVTQVAESE